MPSSESQRLAVVTGASGFLGRHLVQRLVASGRPVRAIVRRVDEGLPTQVEQLVVPTLDDAGRLEHACTGAQVVYHLAGRAHVLRESAQDPITAFRRVNVDGTQHVARAAAAARVPVFVLMSSVAAGLSPVDGRISEDPACAPRSPYGVSKREAEAVGAEIMHASGARFVALRPPMTYGPGMKGNPLSLFRWLARGRPLPLGGIAARRSVAYVDNVIDAATFLEHEPAAAGAYLVRDDELPTVAEFVRVAAAALGQRARLITVPAPLLRVVASVGDRISNVVPVPLTSARLASVIGPLVIDASRLHHLGFHPRVSMRDGLTETARWFLASTAT